MILKVGAGNDFWISQKCHGFGVSRSHVRVKATAIWHDFELCSQFVLYSLYLSVKNGKARYLIQRRLTSEARTSGTLTTMEVVLVCTFCTCLYWYLFVPLVVCTYFTCLQLLQFVLIVVCSGTFCTFSLCMSVTVALCSRTVEVEVMINRVTYRRCSIFINLPTNCC